MKLIDGTYLDDFLNSRDYDIRKTHNGRWIDQKCTPDVLSIIADCILEYLLGKEPGIIFKSVDIWLNDYTVQNVLDIFKKPSPKDQAARNEYDKFFQQPMELLSYAGILKKDNSTGRNFYSLLDKDLLEAISLSERNALKFLTKYITKVLVDSDIYHIFEDFFRFQNPRTLYYIKKWIYKFHEDKHSY